MHPHPADVPGVGQAHVGPGLPAVGGPIHPIAVGHVAADARLAHAGVNDVGVGRGHGDGAHRGGIEVAVGNILPVGAAVVGLPHPAGAGAEIEDHGIYRVAGHCHHPSATGRADAAPPHGAEQLLGDVRSRGLVLLRCTGRHRRTSDSRAIILMRTHFRKSSESRFTGFYDWTGLRDFHHGTVPILIIPKSCKS